jgi:hypothetical protein
VLIKPIAPAALGVDALKVVCRHDRCVAADAHAFSISCTFLSDWTSPRSVKNEYVNPRPSFGFDIVRLEFEHTRLVHSVFQHATANQ